MKHEPSYLIQGKNIILVIDGKSHTISRDTHLSYNKIVEAIKVKDWASVKDLVDPVKTIVKFSNGRITVDGDVLYWDNEPFHNALSTRIISMLSEGFPVDPMVAFMENLMANPSKRSVDQLYTFLERNSLPITPDGHFLAFKRVRGGTYLDIHSGTIDNSVGQTVEMTRNLVDDNPDSHCSVGLHFCSESYLDHFGSRNDPIMILKINPADVVSIPTDYDGAKGRCCRYTVVAELNGDPATAFAESVNYDYSDNDNSVDHDYSDITEESGNEEMPDCTLYDLRRVSNQELVAQGLTKDQALQQIKKNVAQKKAKLEAFYAGSCRYAHLA